MKTQNEPNEKSFAINKKSKLDPQSGFRISGFVVPFSENGIHLLKNILTGEIVQLTPDEYAAAMAIEGCTVNYEYIKQNNLDELALRRFIVEDDYNEAEQYMTTVKLIRIMQPEKEGLKTYTILPTTSCNARCTYCYEEGYAVKTMDKKTADRLIDFICETRWDDKITLAWFGGEPTVCAEMISYICKVLEDRGVPFKSRMITNASLITRELAHEMKEVWKLGRVQVSLDGDKRDYTERKRYIDPVRYNYDTVMNSIGYLADEDINVILRVNFDRDSIGRLKPFLDEMKARFGGNKKVTLYLAPLYQEKSKPGFIDLEHEMYELNRYINELGINSVEREKRTTAFRLNSCMADSLDKSIVIDPEGLFYNCEHLPEENTWGNIFDGITDQKRYEELTARLEPDEKCRSCAFLPQCTPFYKQGCPGWFDTCQEYQYLKTEYELRSLADRLTKEK